MKWKDEILDVTRREPARVNTMWTLYLHWAVLFGLGMGILIGFHTPLGEEIIVPLGFGTVALSTVLLLIGIRYEYDAKGKDIKKLFMLPWTR